MHFSNCVCGIIFIALFYQVRCLETINGQYGETIEVPCNKGALKQKDLFMIKWKYDNGDLLTQKKDKTVSVIASNEYKDRVSMTDNYSLRIAALTLKDEKTYTCMVVAESDISEYPVKLLILKAPTRLEITDTATELEIGKLMQLGQCSAHDAYPAADITWYKNNSGLNAGGRGISITSKTKVDETTGLTTSTSILQYTAEKEDTNALFTCGVQKTMSLPVSFTITYPTEKISLRVLSEPLLEGDNVTLQCEADGNPPPTSFNFHIQGKEVKVNNSDIYIMTDVTRESTGEYKCSLVNNAKMEDSKIITINYLDVSLSPSGKVTKSVGEGLAIHLQSDASGDLKLVWTKDNSKLDKQPKFNKLTYADSGTYEAVVTMGTLVKKASFELIVEGVPVIQRLVKQRAKDSQHKVLICEAEGSPKPTVAWNVNGTSADESLYIHGKITHKLTIVPVFNLTVVCSVSNELGQDSKAINVSTLLEEVKMHKRDSSNDQDRTKLVVGLVVSLLLAAVMVGLAYWLYMKKSKQGSWKTGEKEDGSNEESKKLEEKIDEKLEENSQKVEV